MKNRRKVIIPLLIIVLAAVFGYSYRERTPPAQEAFIRLSGNIEATLVKVGFKIPGRISKRLADEGHAVKEGQLIAKIEDRELMDQKNKAEAAQQALQAKGLTLLTIIKKEEMTSSAEITKAEATLRAAQSRLSEVLSGARPQEIEQAKAEVNRTKSELEKEGKYLERARYLYQGGYVAAKDWDAAKANYEVCLARHKIAEEQHALVKEGPRKEEIERAKAQVEEARAALSLAQSKQLQVKVYRQEKEVLKAQINEAKAVLEVARRQLEYSEIYAPISGVVMIKSAEEGEYVSPGTPVVTIADLDHVWLRAYLDETDLGKVKLGQNVRIKTDTFSGKVYPGKISFISSEAEFTPKQVQTQKERVKLVYRVKIDIENAERELKPGMPADGEILLDQQ